MVVNKVSVFWSVMVTSVLCAGAPLLMAVINPRWPYWYDAFFAQLLTPMSADVLFTVGLLVVSASFPQRMQALAGAVFNTSAQLGSSIGLTVLSVISTSVTEESGVDDLRSPRALMEGYRASFWALFAFTATAIVVGGLGLRKVGKVGDKRD
jgi:MFS family permease